MANGSFTFTLNASALDALLADILPPWLQGKLDAIAAVARGNLNSKSGRLAASITTRIEGSGSRLVGYVLALAPYALAHHNGARPHVILPRNARVLVFPDDAGTTVFARKVNHPGNAPNPFLLDALVQVISATEAA